MLKSLEKVIMFRCVQDPMIGPKPRNAFMMPDLPDWEAWYNAQTGSVYVKTNIGRRHVVPTGNLSSIELEKDNGEIQAQNGKEEKKGPGRPRKDSPSL